MVMDGWIDKQIVVDKQINIQLQIDRQIDRQIDKQIDRQIDRQMIDKYKAMDRLKDGDKQIEINLPIISRAVTGPTPSTPDTKKISFQTIVIVP